MVPRPTLIAVLIGVEVAILYGMVVAIGIGSPAQSIGFPGAPSGPSGLTFSSPQSFAVGNRPALAIDVGMADVTIDTHAVARIDVAVSDGMRHVGSSVPIIARADGDTVRISANETDFWSFLGDSRIVNITVPPATAVSILNAGNVTATGLRADASIVSGAHFHDSDGIRVRDFKGSLSTTTAGGRVEITDASCPELQIAAADGRVRLTRVQAQNIDASSSNGRVDGTDVQLRNGSVSSSNGRVSLQFASGTDTTVTAGAANGHIDVSGFAARPAKFAQSDSDSDDEDDDDNSASAQTIRVGAGSGRLDVHASNGSIYLSQEG